MASRKGSTDRNWHSE